MERYLRKGKEISLPPPNQSRELPRTTPPVIGTDGCSEGELKHDRGVIDPRADTVDEGSTSHPSANAAGKSLADVLALLHVTLPRPPRAGPRTSGARSWPPASAGIGCPRSSGTGRLPRDDHLRRSARARIHWRRRRPVTPPALRCVQSPLSAEGANGRALPPHSRGIARLARTRSAAYSCACGASDRDVTMTASPIDVEGDTCHHVLANGSHRASARCAGLRAGARDTLRNGGMPLGHGGRAHGSGRNGENGLAPSAWRCV